MFMKEFGRVSAQQLNQELNKVYRWQLDLNRINESDASNMLGTLRQKINKIRSTNQAHQAERNPEFMEAVMVSRVLESWKTEIETANRRALNERTLKPGEEKKREKYVKGMKKMKGDFQKRYGNRSDEVMYATATKMAKTESVNDALRLLKFTLIEGEVEQARVTMAARDMVDTIQDLVEKIGKMQNEQLPALVTAMKDEVGIDQANQFNQTAGDSLRAVMDAITASRDAMDNASRGVYGAAPMATGTAMAAGGNMTPDEMGAMPGDTGAADMAGGDMGAEMPEEPESDLNTADVAAGGTAELGRGKRV
jgi:hypothetical protein